MKKAMLKTTFREIRQSLGRYLAILAIVALGVGIFTGLKVTKPFMVSTIEHFFEKHQLYDFQLVSTYGFEEEDFMSAELEAVPAGQRESGAAHASGDGIFLCGPDLRG